MNDISKKFNIVYHELLDLLDYAEIEICSSVSFKLSSTKYQISMQ